MLQRLMRILIVVLVLGVAWPTTAALDPSLVGWWRLDEGVGTVATDSSGNSNNGALMGDPEWRIGRLDMALQFDGDGDYVDCGADAVFDITEQLTLAIWVNANDMLDGQHNCWLGKGDNAYAIKHQSGNFLEFFVYGGDWYSTNYSTNLDSLMGEWHHMAGTFDGNTLLFYLDGEEAASQSFSGAIDTATHPVTLGENSQATGRFFDGMLDDARIYNRALTQDEIQQVMKGGGDPALAADPEPENEQVDVPRTVTLSWSPGESAVTHDLYLSTVFEDVNTADPGARLSQGRTDTEYTPDAPLEFGQTYYWRVDEVNGAPDNTVFAGEVWHFTVEPIAYPIPHVTATASSSQADTMGAENTVNGSGLNEADEHSVTATDMWLSSVGDPAPFIEYEFDKTYKLHAMQIWNSNQIIESFLGLGAKDVIVEYCADGTEWTVLEGVTQFAQAAGDSTYTANTTVDFGGAMARFVRITISSGYGMMPQYGLSEVRFLFIPTFARTPQPADGTITPGADVMLSWRAGREAVDHQVYLGTDAAEMALVGTTSETAFAASNLDYSTTYYWSITEVNENETVSSHAGDVWHFTTPDYGTVDDFEQYDNNCNRIFFAWEDGLGHNGGEELDNCDEAPSNGNGGGSTVGNNTTPFAEKTIVNAGGSTQSLPFSYDNAFGPSESTLSLAGQDWTASKVRTLSIAFSGTAGNTGTLYVKINSSKIVYDQDPADITQSAWQIWNIDLTTVGGLQDVTSLTVGVDGASAAGMLYIDDIRLYPGAGN